MSERIQLSSGLDKTTTWVWMENDQLKVEYYDFSESAQETFGNDIAYTLTVHDMRELYSLIEQNEDSLVNWVVQNFKSYFGIKQWLEQNGLGFSVETESRA